MSQNTVVSAIDRVVLGHLEQRIGLFQLRQRVAFEAQGEDETRDLFHRLPVKQVLPRLLRLAGLADRGLRNALDLQVTRNRLAVLPPGSRLSGCTILHLSDLHLEHFPELIGAVTAAIAPLRYDMCLLTGDFAFRHNLVDAVVDGVRDLHEAITAPTYAILGNHDSIRIVPPLERAGIRFLINEHVRVETSGGAFLLAGVDDCVHYRASNLERALEGADQDGLTVLMNHAPVEYREAADAYLTGHTHGGQICLPGGIPIMSNASAPRRLISGAWRCGAMQGYTSRGVGASMVRVRFNCRPEIVLHELVAR